MFKGNPNNILYKTELLELKRTLKKNVKRNKSRFKQTLVGKLEWSKNDSKTFWITLDKLEKKRDNEHFKECIFGVTWVNHFKSILQNQSNADLIPPNNSPSGPLDYEISEEELKLSAYILKSGKASGYDCISYEMISCLLETNLAIIKKLFNALITFPTVIRQWQTSVISTIHKKVQKSTQIIIGVYLCYPVSLNFFWL